MEKQLNFCVIGHPIGHTMSPFINKRLFALRKENADYGVMDIPPETLAEQMAVLRTKRGFNVTIPHKQRIIPFLTRLDESARRFGSVNTVCVEEDGTLTGHTTDGPGCLMALRGRGIRPEGRLLLLGAGGAARAVAFALCEEASFLQLTIACRRQSAQKAESLCREIQAYRMSLQKEGTATPAILEELDGQTEYDLLLNCTSVGMYPNDGASPVPDRVIARCHAVFDAVYNPHTTRLLQLAEGRGIPTVHGMDMLVWQAAVAHKYWFGHTFTPDEINGVIEAAVEEMARRFEKKGANA